MRIGLNQIEVVSIMKRNALRIDYNSVRANSFYFALAFFSTFNWIQSIFPCFFLSLSCSSLGVHPFSFSFLSVALLHFVDFSFSMVLNMFDPFVISFVEITFSARQPFFCIFRKLSAAKRSFVLPNKKQIIVFKNNCIRRASRAEKRPELNKNRWKRKPLVTCVKYAIYE